MIVSFFILDWKTIIEIGQITKTKNTKQRLLGEITQILKGDNQGMFKHLIVCEFDYIMWLVKHIFQTVKQKLK